MPRDLAYYLSQSVADFARFAATVNAELDATKEALVTVTAERDAARAELAKTKAEQP